MSTVTIRIDDATKRDVSNIAKDFGLDISTITRAFYKQIQREHRIPLNLGYEVPNKKTLKAMKESRKLAYDKNVKGYTNMDDLKEALLS